jgi:hypothetical protein
MRCHSKIISPKTRKILQDDLLELKNIIEAVKSNPEINKGDKDLLLEKAYQIVCRDSLIIESINPVPNCNNSGQPPSQDLNRPRNKDPEKDGKANSDTKEPKDKKNKPTTKRNPGGQKGHIGNTLPLDPNPYKIVYIYLDNYDKDKKYL